MRIWCDMDGVLADFDTAYERVMGCKLPDRNNRTEDLDWESLRSRAPRFFRDLPLMPGALHLWQRIEPHGAHILTGVPPEVERSDNDKITWGMDKLHVAAHRIVCTRARYKFHHCKPGDILIDDWERYRKNWEDAGGLWITHVDAQTTLRALNELGIR